MEQLVSGIILAAGLSTRMRGRQKLLMDMGGIPVIERVVRAALTSSLSQIILVVAPEHGEMRKALGSLLYSPRLSIAPNAQAAQGISSSLRIGLQAVSQDATGVMILLGDQPLISSDVINILVVRFLQLPNKIVAPCVRGRRSNPVIFPMEFIPELRQIEGDVGGRTVIQRHEDRLETVELGIDYDDIDVDTPEDFERARDRLAKLSRSLLTAFLF